MKPYELIEQGAALIEATGWSQGANARDADGCGTSVCMDYGPAKAVAFCAYGALLRAEGTGNNYRFVVDQAVDAFNNNTPERSVVKFNDTPGRTKEEVLALMRATAAKLRAEYEAAEHAAQVELNS